MELKVQLCVRKKTACAMHTFKDKNLQQFSTVANSNSASESFCINGRSDR